MGRVPDRAGADRDARHLLEAQGLGAQLNTLGFPRPLGHVGSMTALVVHRHDPAVFAFQQIDARDDPDLGRRQQDRPRVDAVVGALPPGPGVAIIVCWCGPIEQGERALEPLRRFAPPIASTIGVVPYATVQTLLDAALPSGDFHYWKSNFFKDLTDTATDALVDSVSAIPASRSRVASMVALEHLGGAVGRIAPQETAFSHRGAEHSFLVLSVWRDRAESEQHLQWARKVWDAMRPFLAEGVYVNYLGDDEAGGRVASAYGENYNRLAAIKKKYDPKNVFRINQNIKPAA